LKGTVLWDVVPMFERDPLKSKLGLENNGTDIGRGRTYSFAIKMETTGSSKIMVTIYQTTQYHIPDDSNLHGHQ
jgi:hypothetical protein